MKQNLKLCCGAFLAAGITGLVGEILMDIIGAIAGPGIGDLGIVITLFIMGVVGAILSATGTYKRIQEKTEFGIDGTFVGFPPAAAGAYVEERQKGTRAGKAAAKGIGSLLLVVLIGVVAVAIVAFIGNAI
jgi:hypothetical protein